MPHTPTANTLFYGDNLDILREHVADDSIDLIYLDPPFNSNASYDLLFKSPAIAMRSFLGREVEAASTSQGRLDL